MSDERLLAVELDRALAGDVAGAEARELAALLVAVAEPLRFEVPVADVERALAGAEPRPRRASRLLPALGVAAVVAAAALVWALRIPGIDAQARAARAVDATFFFVEQVRPERPALFPATDVTGYVDGRNGLAHLRVTTGGRVVAETVVLRHAVERWVAASNTLSVADSCDVFNGGCAEVLDPLTLYVRTVESPGVSAERVGDTYRLTIHGARVDEVVVVDAATFLPHRIEWREHGRLIATARFTTLERQAQPLPPDALTMFPHPGAHVIQVVRHGRLVHVAGARPASLQQGDFSLGASYEGHRATTTEVTFTPSGSARRTTYGSVVVWNYGSVFPPAVLQGRAGPAKVFGFRGGVANVYFGQAETVVATLGLGSRNVAVISRTGDKEEALRALDLLRVVGR